MSGNLATNVFRVLATFWIINNPASARNDCTAEVFAISQLYNNLKPVEGLLKEESGSTVMGCSTRCYRNISCTGFLFNKDEGGLCSMYKERFRSATHFVNQSGSLAFGKSFSIPC